MARLSYEVQITGADNGVIVRVGCKTLVFKNTEIDEFLSDLKALLLGEEGKLREKYYPEEMIAKTPLDGQLIGRPHPGYGNEVVQANCVAQGAG